MKAKPRIILTDDDSNVLSILKEMVSLSSADVYATTDPREALSWAMANPPDLFITDLAKPDIDGVSLIGSLRADERTRDVLVWVISGHADDHQGRGAVVAGADLVMLKPCRAIDVIGRLDRLFGLSLRDPMQGIIDAGIETPDVDFKSAADFKSRDGCASIAKDVIGLANFGGGYLVFGVEEIRPGRFRAIGCSEEMLDQLEVTALNKAIRDYIAPPHHVSSRIAERGGKQLVIVSVPPAQDVPLLARKQNERAQLFLGRIYTRNSAAETAEAREPEELRAILERVITRRLTRTEEDPEPPR